MLLDPKVRDPWARDVATLAPRGSGRHPFQLEGGIVVRVDMPRARRRHPLGAAIVVPCELDGERIFALVATGSSEVFIDSQLASRPRLGELPFSTSSALEVKDVPALVQDLAPIARQLGVPIKALIGVNFLRHAHVTFDRRGRPVRRPRRTIPRLRPRRAASLSITCAAGA